MQSITARIKTLFPSMHLCIAAMENYSVAVQLCFASMKKWFWGMKMMMEGRVMEEAEFELKQRKFQPRC
jgi:hypothetical protein